MTELFLTIHNLNDNGQIAFSAKLADGRIGIYRTNPVSTPGPGGTGQLQITLGAPQYQADVSVGDSVIDWRIVFPVTLTNTGGTSLYMPTLTGGKYGNGVNPIGSAVYAAIPGVLQPATPSNPQPLDPGAINGEIPPGGSVTAQVGFLFPSPSYPFPSGASEPISLSLFAYTRGPDPVTGFQFVPTQQTTFSLWKAASPTHP